MRLAAALGAIAAALLASGAARAQALPPFTLGYNPIGVDERGIWSLADERERELRDSNLVIRDPELDAFVRRVLCRTVGEDRCGGVRIYVLHVPAFNATMSPNGTMEIWSGLLLRVRSEAELGAVLGHEFGHFELRHTLKAFKRARSASDAMMWSAILVPYSSSLQFGLLGSVFSFNRDQERQADLQGLAYLRASAYPADAAAAVWTRLMAEQDASMIARGRKPKQKYQAGFFASHPTELTRATYLAKAAEGAPAGRDPQAAAYRAAMAKWLPQFLDDQVKLNDFGATEYLLSALAGGDWTPELLLARGNLYRQRGNPRDLAAAAEFYREAIARGSLSPEARRDLGLVLLRSHQDAPAHAALREYLEMKPDASDARMIRTLLDS